MAFKVMGASCGGISYDNIMDMTFPELANLWGEAIQINR